MMNRKLCMKNMPCINADSYLAKFYFIYLCLDVQLNWCDHLTVADNLVAQMSYRLMLIESSQVFDYSNCKFVAHQVDDAAGGSHNLRRNQVLHRCH